jgi:serine protease Do
MTSQEKYSSGWVLGRTVLLGLAAGAGAGIVGAVWTSRALSDYADALRVAQHIPQISVTQPTPIPGTYEEALSRVRTRAQASVAAFLPQSTDGSAPSGWLFSSDVAAYGVVVSDDGWIAVEQSAFIGFAKPEDMLEVWIAQTRYTITDIVTDDATGVVMVHVDAKNLVSIDFASTEGVRSGTMMFAVGETSVLPTEVMDSDVRVKDGVLPAETFATAWNLSVRSDVSMPVLNAAGDLAGFIRAGTSTVLPLHHVLEAIRDVVKDGAISVPALGAYTVDLAETMAIAPSVRQDLRAGALVVAPNASTRAVLVGGPAADAGLVLGDVILSVDGELITQSTSLAELLATYDVGDVARLSVYRGGETVSISVTLEDQSAVIY